MRRGDGVRAASMVAVGIAIGAAGLWGSAAGGAATDAGPPFETYAQDLAAVSPADAIAYFHRVLPDLRAGEATTPGLALEDLAGEMTADGLAAQLDEATALADLQRASAASDPAAASLRILPEMMKPMFDLAASGPEDAQGLAALGLAIDAAEARGLTAAEITGDSPGPTAQAIFDKAQAAAKGNSDAAALQQADLSTIETFLGHVAGLVPKSLAPALASPAEVFFEDLMKWNLQMWSASTDGLTLVSKAIETGKLDTAAYDRLSKRLEALGRQGPWTAQSGVDFAKKLAAAIPGVGKVLPALWGAFGGSKAAAPKPLPAVPISTAATGQLPPQSFSFTIDDHANLTQSVAVTASPGYEVHSDGSVGIGLVKIGQDALPDYFHVVVTTLRGSGSEEANRWQGYTYQQVAKVRVHYDNGAVEAVPTGFDVVVAAPAGAAAVTGIDLDFAPLGNPVTLHWPADIPIN